MFRSLMIVSCLSLASTAAVGSAVRYDYVGAPIPEGVGNYASFLPSGITHISGYFILDNPLAASTFSGSVGPTEFMFTDGLVTVTGSTSGYNIAGGVGYGFISIGTDADGFITKWSINVARDFEAATGGGPPANRHHFLQTAFDYAYPGTNGDYTAYRFPLTAGNQQAVAYVVAGGTWSASPVPVPPAVLLFGSALGLMGAVRRKISG